MNKENNMVCSPEIYSNALAIIKHFEGLRLTAYQDTGGVWTIGWGSIEGVFKGMVITTEQAKKRLASDFVWKAVRPVSRLVKAELSKNQLEALYSFVFNIGEGQFSTSTMLKKINSGASEKEIAAEFIKWRFDDGKEVAGLKNRRTVEKSLFLSEDKNGLA